MTLAIYMYNRIMQLMTTAYNIYKNIHIDTYIHTTTKLNT